MDYLNDDGSDILQERDDNEALAQEPQFYN